MNEKLARYVLYFLVAIHTLLGLWAIVGWLEWSLPIVPWTKLSNPSFDRTMLVVHWSAILAASVFFLAGYFTRSKRTPFAMTIIYVVMAGICAIQTFFYLESDLKYAAMIAEYATYGVIILLLWRVPFFRGYFSQ